MLSSICLEWAPSEVGVPSISIYELEVGIARSGQARKRRAQLDELLNLIRILPFDGLAAATAAHIRVTLEKKGRPIGPLDTLIAGIALVHGGVLITRNLREFSRVPKLKVVDWY